jgi:hypothetical protein
MGNIGTLFIVASFGGQFVDLSQKSQKAAAWQYIVNENFCYFRDFCVT